MKIRAQILNSSERLNHIQTLECASLKNNISPIIQRHDKGNPQIL